MSNTDPLHGWQPSAVAAAGGGGGLWNGIENLIIRAGGQGEEHTVQSTVENVKLCSPWIIMSTSHQTCCSHQVLLDNFMIELTERTVCHFDVSTTSGKENTRDLNFLGKIWLIARNVQIPQNCDLNPIFLGGRSQYWPGDGGEEACDDVFSRQDDPQSRLVECPMFKYSWDSWILSVF